MKPRKRRKKPPRLRRRRCSGAAWAKHVGLGQLAAALRPPCVAFLLEVRLSEVVADLGIDFLEEIKIIGILHVFSFFDDRQRPLELLHVHAVETTEQLRLVLCNSTLYLFGRTAKLELLQLTFLLVLQK